MTQEDLDNILDKHKLWLSSENEDGTRADLCNAYLVGANLRNADLSNALIIRADLRGANLTGVAIRGANLTGADTSGAKNIVSFQIGKSNRISYAVRHKDCVMFKLGCFWGNTNEAIEEIRKDYRENSHYEKLVLLYSDPDFWIENGHSEK